MLRFFNFFYQDGQSPLHMAAMSNSIEIVKLLLVARANIDLLDKVIFYFIFSLFGWVVQQTIFIYIPFHTIKISRLLI